LLLPHVDYRACVCPIFARYAQRFIGCFAFHDMSEYSLYGSTPSRVRRNLLAGLGMVFTLFAGTAMAQSAPQMNLQRTQLSAGMHMLDVQLAQTPDQRQIGLMFRKEMPQHEGMLFVFDQPATQCFWMRNTLIALSTAFVADDGTIVNIADMKPQSDVSHCSEKPVRYVLEMNQGWFAKKQIKPGYKLGGAVFSR